MVVTTPRRGLGCHSNQNWDHIVSTQPTVTTCAGYYFRHERRPVGGKRQGRPGSPGPMPVRTPRSPGIHLALYFMLESLQKRALKIIFCDIAYHTSLILAGLDTLYCRRELILQRFYKQNIVHSSSCLNYLLPEQRDFVNKLRCANKYEPFLARTEWYCTPCQEKK